MEILGNLVAGAALCFGSMAFVLVLLYARRTRSRAWLLTSLMIAVLSLQALNLRSTLLPRAGAAGIASPTDFRDEALFAEFLVFQALGSLINLSMLGLFPSLLFAFRLIGLRTRRIMAAIICFLAAYQAGSLFLIFLHIRLTGELGELPVAGNLLFIAYLLFCFLAMFLGRKRSTPMFREFLSGSLPLLLTIFPFLAADLFSLNYQGISGTFLKTGMILYFCFFFAYAATHFFSILRMEREEEGRRPERLRRPDDGRFGDSACADRFRALRARG